MKFCFQRGHTRGPPSDQVRFSASNRRGKGVHVRRRIKIPSLKNTVVATFIVQPIVFKMKDFVFMKRRVLSYEK